MFRISFTFLLTTLRIWVWELYNSFGIIVLLWLLSKRTWLAAHIREGNNSQYYNEQYPIPTAAASWMVDIPRCRQPSPPRQRGAHHAAAAAALLSIRKHWKNAWTIGYVCHNEEEMSNIWGGYVSQINGNWISASAHSQFRAGGNKGARGVIAPPYNFCTWINPIPLRIQSWTQITPTTLPHPPHPRFLDLPTALAPGGTVNME